MRRLGDTTFRRLLRELFARKRGSIRHLPPRESEGLKKTVHLPQRVILSDIAVL